jgi:hypothetical protein
MVIMFALVSHSMNTLFNRANRYLHWLVLSATCLGLAGCDPTGEYEQRRQVSLQQAGQLMEVTKHLGAEVSIPDHTHKGNSGVSFSVPKIFGTQPLPAGNVGALLKAAILYEMAESFGDGPLLYISVVGSETVPDEAAMQAMLEQALKAASPQATVTAESLQLTAIGSKAVPPMLRVTMTGPQAFFRPQPGVPVPIEKPGVTDIYIVRGKADIVAFVFRATTASADANNFAQVVEASMRTVSAK